MAINHNRAGAPSGVRLDDSRLHLNIVIELVTAANLLRRFPPDEWFGLVVRMLEHGASALEAAYTSSTLQLVTTQIDAAVAEMHEVLAATITQGWATAAEMLTKMLNDHEKALTAGIAKYLDGNSKTGLQTQMATVFDKAGQDLFVRVAKAFEDGDESALGRYLAKFSQEVQKGFAALAAQQAVRHHTETATALSGAVYEEAVYATLVEIARACGDVPEHCAATLGQLRRRNGDIFSGINEQAARGADRRVVLELKRRADGAQAFSITAIRGFLKLSKENRGAQAGIFLVEDSSLLPGNSGFLELGGGDFATVYQPGGSTLGLAVAYRLARLGALATCEPADDGEGIDLAAAQRTVTEIRQGMTRLEQIRTQHSTAIGAIQRAGTAVQDLVDAVLAGLRRLDEIVGA